MMVHKLNSSTWEEEEKRVLGIQGYFFVSENANSIPVTWGNEWMNKSNVRDGYVFGFY